MSKRAARTQTLFRRGGAWCFNVRSFRTRDDFPTERVADLLVDFGILDGSAEEIPARVQAISEVEPREWATYREFGEEETRVAQVWLAYWADPGDPQFLILTGDHDLDFWALKDRAGFAEWLQELGVEAAHVLLPDTGHTTFGRDASAWQVPLDEYLDQVVDNQ